MDEVLGTRRQDSGDGQAKQAPIVPDPDLSATNPKHVVDTVARTHEQPVDALLLAISVSTRYDELRRSSPRPQLKVCDTVTLCHNLRPLYLHGQQARVVSRDGETWVLRLRSPPEPNLKNADYA